MDLRIRLGTNLEELVTLRPDRTMTTWDPAYFPGGDQFWLHGRNEGKTCFVIAARKFLAADLQCDLKSLRIFYVNPEFRQDTCQVNVTKLHKGISAHTGNLWIAPAFRGQGIPAIATRALHKEILSRWDVDWIWGLQEKELAYKGLWQDQGYAHCEGEVIWSGNPYAQTFRMKIVYGSRQEIIAGL